MLAEKHNKNILVSIIILNYETLNLTSNCIRSVLGTLYEPFEIVVLDNGSGSEDFNRLREIFTDFRVKVFRSRTNLGFAEGCNYALHFCSGKYLMLLNSDTEVDPNWLWPLVSFLEDNPQVAVAQSKLLSLRDKNYFEYAGAAGGLMDIFGYPFTRGRIFKTVEKDSGQYNKPIRIVWSVGAAMFIRKEVVDEIGLFDPIYFTYGEEADFCFRIYSCGGEVYSLPESVVYHLGAATSSRNMLKKLHFNHRNGWILIFKNYPLFLLLLTIPIRFLLDLINILYYLFTNKISYIFSVFWAWAELLFLLPKIVKSRFNNQKIIHKFGHKNRFPPFYIGSIILDYFIRGKHTYDKIFN